MSYSITSPKSHSGPAQNSTQMFLNPNAQKAHASFSRAPMMYPQRPISCIFAQPGAAGHAILSTYGVFVSFST